MTQEWRIRRKQGACALCGRGFEEGERLRSLLCIEEAEIARRDLCADCCAGAPDEATLSERVRAALAAEAAASVAAPSSLEAQAAAQAQSGDGAAPIETGIEQAPAPFALYWWSTRQRGTLVRKVQLDMDLIERLFLDLEGRAEEKLRELRYLLCLLLMRKRRLKLDAVRRGEGGEALLVHRPRRTERLVVHVHDFGADRMDELRARLEALLEGVEPEAALAEAAPGGADAADTVSAAPRVDAAAEDSGGDPHADAQDPTHADDAAPSAGARL